MDGPSQNIEDIEENVQQQVAPEQQVVPEQIREERKFEEIPSPSVFEKYAEEVSRRQPLKKIIPTSTLTQEVSGQEIRELQKNQEEVYHQPQEFNVQIENLEHDGQIREFSRDKEKGRVEENDEILQQQIRLSAQERIEHYKRQFELSEISRKLSFEESGDLPEGEKDRHHEDTSRLREIENFPSELNFAELNRLELIDLVEQVVARGQLDAMLGIALEG